MSASGGTPWLRATLLAGFMYLIVGRVTILPSDNVHIWRVVAWLMSVVVFVAHIGYEHVKLRNAPRNIAIHVAIAVAIGAFGLAIAGMIHSVTLGQFRPAWFVALVAWPAVTAIPAFFAALVVAVILRRLSQNPDTK